MCFIGRTIAYLCLDMINFYAMNFSERRSEEVMFSFDAQCTLRKYDLLFDCKYFFPLQNKRKLL